MRTLPLLPAFLVAGLLACDRAPVAPDITPSFDFANAPDQSGIVERDNGPAAWTWRDTQTGWRVSFGVDLAELCNGVVSLDDLHWADKVLPGDVLRIVSLNEIDEARTAVWPFTAFDCDLFTTVEPLASGLTSFRYIDNDLFGTGTPEANSWRFLGNGTLARADGSAAQFSFHRQLVSNIRGGRVVSQKLTLK